MNRLIIFDLDGVLFESRDMHWTALNSALAHSGLQPISHEEHNLYYNGLPTRVKLARLGLDDAMASRVEAKKQAHTLGWVYKNVKRNDILVALFTDLHIAGWKIAVASNAITVTVIRALQLLGLWSLCDFVTAGDRVVHPKPNPEMYDACMQACDSKPSLTWIVEDSPIGREGVRASGATLVAVNGPSEVNEAVRTIMEIA